MAGSKRIAQHNKVKSASRYATKKPSTRKPPKKGKTTVKPTRILGRPGLKIKKTF